jgi:hypothetical protein
MADRHGHGLTAQTLNLTDDQLRAALEAGLTDEQARQLAERLRVHPDLAPLLAEPVRTFASAGTLSAETDLAERIEEILRTGATWHGRVILVADRGRGERPRRLSVGV